jgi:hypothetical protein
MNARISERLPHPHEREVGISYMCFVLVTGNPEAGTCCAGTMRF